MAEDSFGRRLRSERERRRISLEAIAANTKISIGLLKGLERDDVSRWPSGIFRRSFIRSYAVAIGLDADETVHEFLERFPDPMAPAPLSIETTPTDATQKKVPPRALLRLTLAESRPPFSGGLLLTTVKRRLAAVAWDAGSTLAISLTAFIVMDKFWAPLAAAMLCYYLGGILILGNTPGVCLFAPRSDHDDTPPASREEDSVPDLPSDVVLRRGFIS